VAFWRASGDVLAVIDIHQRAGTPFWDAMIPDDAAGEGEQDRPGQEARALVMDHGGQKKEHHDDEAERHEAAAQAGLPVAGDPAVSGLDVTVRGMGTIGMPAQDAADNQND
jgi:hypothetical protein